MSRISGLGTRGVSYSAARSQGVPSRASAAASSNPPARERLDAFTGAFSRSELLAMNAGIDQASRTSNALSTAADAIGVIGGLLGNIQTVLSAAGTQGNADFDTGTEQSRIDSAITTIDAIASSSRFGGQPLLDGSFTVSSGTTTVAIPSFVSSTLGSSNAPGVTSAPLSSLASGGANDLASGNLDVAGQIVTTAMSQVGQSQDRISTALSSSQQLTEMEEVDHATVASAASEMIADPSTASDAAANSSGQRVLALLT